MLQVTQLIGFGGATSLVKGPNIAPEATASMTSSGAVTPNPERLNDGTTSGQAQGTNSGGVMRDVEYRFDFGAGNKKVVHSYSLLGPSSDSPPRDYALDGSDDASFWTTLHSTTGEGALGNGAERAHNDIGNITPYRHYRVNVSENVGATSETRVAEIRLFEGQ